MIILHQYQPAFGIPSASPFCVKAEILLKMAGLKYETDLRGDPRKAPRGKLPFITDGDHVVADSEQIRKYLEEKYGAEFDSGVSDRDRSIGHAFARMIEERLYWAIVYSRWINEDNWPRIRDLIFAPVPALMRPIIVRLAQKQVKAKLYAHGLGRHTEAEIYSFGADDLNAIATQLDYNDYFLGNEITSFDAIVYPFLSTILLSSLVSPLKQSAEQHEAFRPYIARMQEHFFPEFDVKQSN